MTTPIGMYGGAKYQSPTTRALGSITVESYEKVYDDQAQFMSKLAGDVSFLASNARKQQAGIDKANENFIQQFQDMIRDVIVLMGGGGATGFDFGDLKYVLIAIGALFGFTDSNGKITIPVNLFQAAWHFFSNYILPVDNFKDAMNTIVDDIIAAMLDYLGEIPIIGQAAQQLAVIISDIRDTLGPLVDAIDTFFQAFNISFTDTGGITGMFGPFAPIMDALKTALAGVHLPDFTPMFAALAQWSAPFVQLIADVVNAFSPMITDLINMGGGILTPVVDLITPLVAALAPIMDIITQVVIALQPFLDAITAILSMFSVPGATAPSGTDPTTMVADFITNFLNPSGLLASAAGAVMDWANLALSLFGVGGITNQAGFAGLANNFLSFLGNPNFLSGTTQGNATNFIQNILNPAGVLSTFSQLPGHLFGIFAPNNLTNMLPDGGFDIAQYFDDPTMWDGTIGRSTPFGTLKFLTNGTYQQFLGVPVGSDVGKVSNFEVWTTWNSLVTTAGQQIVLAVDAFDANNNLISNPTGRIVNYIANATTNAATYAGAPSQQPPVPASVLGADGNYWVKLAGAYQAPAGTAYIAISPEVTPQTQSGPVHFDDAYQMPDQGFLDSSMLTGFENLLDGAIPGIKVGGLQGIADIIATFATHIDGLYNALNIGSPTETGVPFFNLFDLMQQTGLNAFNAAFISSGLKVLLDNKINMPAITGGTQPSGEANFTHATTADSTTQSNATLATGNAMGGWIRTRQNASKGFVDFLAAKPAAGTTGIYGNMFKQDTTTGVKTKIYGSPDIASVIPVSTTTISTYSQMLIPGGVNVSPNDVVWFELVNNSGGNILVGKKSSPFPDHFNTYPKNFGHTRAIAALGVSPTSLGTSDTTTSQTAPYLNIGIASVPADYHLPQLDQFLSGAGITPWTPPSFIKDGDIINLIGVGGGGSGMSEWNAGIMAGGLGGTPNGGKFVYGSDINGTGLPVIPAGHTLYFRAGAGGVHPGGYWANGNPGANSQWWLDAVDTGTLLVNCAGGAGGSGSVGLSSGTGSGPTPNPFVFDGHSYPMGQNVGIDSTGSSPGGGGGGATWYEFGGSGAPGGGWAFSYKTVG